MEAGKRWHSPGGQAFLGSLGLLLGLGEGMRQSGEEKKVSFFFPCFLALATGIGCYRFLQEAATAHHHHHHSRVLLSSSPISVGGNERPRLMRRTVVRLYVPPPPPPWLTPPVYVRGCTGLRYPSDRGRQKSAAVLLSCFLVSFLPSRNEDRIQRGWMRHRVRNSRIVCM